MHVLKILGGDYLEVGDVHGLVRIPRKYRLRKANQIATSDQMAGGRNTNPGSLHASFYDPGRNSARAWIVETSRS